MPLGIEQLPEYARVWSLVFFGIGIGALLFSFRRTARVQRSRNRRNATQLGERLAQARAEIDEISLKSLYAKYHRALRFTRVVGPTATQRRRLVEISALQSRRRAH